MIDDSSLRLIWDGWCVQFERNDQSENEKLWRSLNAGTAVGWSYLQSRASPEVRAALIFGSAPAGAAAVPAKAAIRYELPTGPVTTGAPSHLDVVRQCQEWNLPIGHDCFADRLVVTGPMPGERQGQWPRPLADRDYTLLRLAFNAMGLKPPTEAVREGLEFWATMKPFNPVTDWLDQLQWDGAARLDDWLIRCMGVEAGDWPRIAGPKFLIAMVARAMQPGCQADNALVLEGSQGIGKSTALRMLAGDNHFGDQLPNMRDKEGLQYLQGLWLVEIKELAAIRRSEIEEVKQFIDARIDRYRNPFGRNVDDHPRRTVFAATTNESVYLKDPTGDRRWWPVRCEGSLDLELLKRDRDQMFAEAVHRYRAGEPWWLSPEQAVIARGEQAKRRKVSEWFNTIAAICAENGDRPLTMQFLFLRLNLPTTELSSPKFTVPIAGDLALLGYRQNRLPGTGARYYVRDTGTTLPQAEVSRCNPRFSAVCNSVTLGDT